MRLSIITSTLTWRQRPAPNQHIFTTVSPNGSNYQFDARHGLVTCTAGLYRDGPPQHQRDLAAVEASAREVAVHIDLPKAPPDKKGRP